MAKYRKKPVIVEAVQFLATRESFDAILAMGLRNWKPGEMGTNTFIIETLEGDHLVRKDDYIIKGVKGEFYPCKPDIFEMTYEKVNDENPETITKETSLNVIVESLVKGEASFIMKCPLCGKRTISSQQVYIHDNIKREWYCRNCGQKLNNYNLLKKEV